MSSRHLTCLLALSMTCVASYASAAVSFRHLGEGGLTPSVSGNYVAYGEQSTDTARPADEQLWFGPLDNPQLVAKAGDPAPGLAPLTIKKFVNVIGQDGKGRVAFQAALSDDKSNAVYFGEPGDFKLLAGYGPALQGVTGVITTQLNGFEATPNGNLIFVDLDGNLWVGPGDGPRLLGNNYGYLPWAEGRFVGIRAIQVTNDGTVVAAVRNADTGTHEGFAAGTEASDLSLTAFSDQPLPGGPAADWHPANENGFRDAAGNLLFAGYNGTEHWIWRGTREAGSLVAKLGDPALGVPLNVLAFRAISYAETGRLLVNAGLGSGDPCPQYEHCGTPSVLTGTPDRLYPAVIEGYELPGFGRTCTSFGPVSNINEQGQFSIAGRYDGSASIFGDDTVFLYDPSAGFTKLFSVNEYLEGADIFVNLPLVSTRMLDAGRVLLKLMYGDPYKIGWVLATVTGLPSIGTDVGVVATTDPGSGGATTGGSPGASTGESSSGAGGGAGQPSTAASGGAGGSGDTADGGSDVDPGCSCSAPGSAPLRAPSALALLAGWAVLAARRGRRAHGAASAGARRAPTARAAADALSR